MHDPGRQLRARWIPLAGLVALALSWGPGRAVAQNPGSWSDFVVGADVSYLPLVEQGGGWFQDSSGRRDALVILRDHGFNLFRLRIWNAGTYDLAYNLALARRIRDVGGAILLDFHYSDTWADPGRQIKPAAWATLPFETLADSVQAYTERVLRAFDAIGALPVAVQVGNEITSGMLAPDGWVGGSSDTPAQWEKLRTLLGRGIAGVRAVGAEITVIVHIDRGGSWPGTQWFFDSLGSTVDFDWIGLSYYPWWHGSMSAHAFVLGQTARRYGKKVLVAETAYPWSTGWFDNSTNIVGPSATLLPEYPATPTGQRDFLRKLVDVQKAQARERAAGWIYWAPDYIAAPRFGSVWENVALFDNTWTWLQEANLTAVESSASAEVPAERGRPEVWPSPATDRVTIFCEAGSVRVFDVLGRPLVDMQANRSELDVSSWTPGAYFARCHSQAAPGRVRPFIVAR